MLRRKERLVPRNEIGKTNVIRTGDVTTGTQQPSAGKTTSEYVPTGFRCGTHLLSCILRVLKSSPVVLRSWGSSVEVESNICLEI
jgi:hypothetical protein